MLGEYVLPHGGAVWTSTVVSALATLGVTERNARQALARLRGQGIVESERHGRNVRWLLTDHAMRLLTTGAERIYGFGTRGESWDGHWLVVICSIPETQRQKRHRLRTRLTFEGFGFVAPSVAVCPHRDRAEAANEILRSLDLDGEAVTLDARTGPLTPDLRLVQSAWQLDALGHRYEGFIEAVDRVDPRTPTDAFRSMILMVDAWRHFPFGDPDLPTHLLPPGWPGQRAQALFESRHQQWGQDATAWYLAAESPVSQTERGR